jgi:hypothetical protein
MNACVRLDRIVIDRHMRKIYIPQVYMTYMPKEIQAMIEIPEEVNQILNIVKARYNLKDKSEAITKVVTDYGIELLEPELRPDFIEKMKKIGNEKAITIGGIEEFKNRYGL